MFNNENLQNSFEFIKGFPKIDELTLTNGKMNGSYDIEDLMNDNENLSQLYSFDLNEKILEEIEDLINSGHLSPKDINKSFMEIIKSNNPEKIFHILQKFKSSNSLTKPVEAFTKIDIDYLHINGNAHEIESNHNYKETDNSNINVSHIRQNINTNIIINNQTKLANSIANLSLSGSNINNIDINVELIEDLSELDKIENDNQSNSNDNSNSSYNYLENLTTDKKDNHDIAITKSHKNQIKRGPSETKLKEILDRTGYSHNITAGQRKYGGPPPDWEGSPPSLGCEIYCGKIPKDIFEDELIPLFEGVDRIWDFRLMIDSSNGGASKGFAFVQYPDKEMAEKAVKTLNNYEIRPGKYLKLNISIPNLRLFVGNIPKSKGKDEIFEEFLKLTDGLVDVIVYSTPGEKRKNRGFCFLQYESHLAASVAKKRLTNNLHSNINPTGLGPGPYYYNLGNNNAPTGNLNYNWPFKRVWNCDIIVEWAQVQEEPPQETMAKVKVLYVSNLTNSVEESELKKAFERFGPVQHVKKVKDYAFVHFGERDHALQAMKEMEGSKHIQGQNGIPIKVSLAKPPSDKKNTTNNSNTSSNVALTLNGRRGDFNNNINSNNNSNKEAFLNYGGNGVYGNLGNNFGQIVNQANQCYYYYVGRRPNNFSNLNPGFNTLNTAAFPAPLYNPHSTRLNKYYHLSEGGAFLPSPNSHIHPSSNINYPMYYPPVMQNPSQLSYLSNFQNIQNHQKSNDIMIDGANPINKEEINNSVNSINNATNNLNLVENSNYNCNVPNCNMLSCSSNIDVDRQPQIYNNGVANYLYENCLAASPGRSLVNNAPPLSPLNPKSYETDSFDPDLYTPHHPSNGGYYFNYYNLYHQPPPTPQNGASVSSPVCNISNHHNSNSTQFNGSPAETNTSHNGGPTPSPYFQFNNAAYLLPSQGFTADPPPYYFTVPRAHQSFQNSQILNGNLNILNKNKQESNNNYYNVKSNPKSNVKLSAHKYIYSQNDQHTANNGLNNIVNHNASSNHHHKRSKGGKRDNISCDNSDTYNMTDLCTKDSDISEKTTGIGIMVVDKNS